jgi:hypothetical protein
MIFNNPEIALKEIPVKIACSVVALAGRGGGEPAADGAGGVSTPMTLTVLTRHPGAFGIKRRFSLAARALGAVMLAACALPALADVPASERAVLIALYEGTNGDGWTDHSGWKTAGAFSAAGTECNWHGVTCDGAGGHVTGIGLAANHLVGELPATLDDLTALQAFDVGNNQLSGAIPALAGLTALQVFHANGNQLHGSIPDLSSLTALHSFYVHDNQLTGEPPAPPPNLILGYDSQLCPNLLSLSSVAADNLNWTVATNMTDWHADCTAPTPPVITTAAGLLPDATVGLAYNGGVAAAGAPRPIFTLTDGDLPPGLSLNPDTGAITGTPGPSSAGNHSFSISASNGVPPNATQTFTIQVQLRATSSIAAMAVPTLADTALALLGLLLAAGAATRLLPRRGRGERGDTPHRHHR